MSRLTILALLLLVFWYMFIREDTVYLGPGVRVPNAPVQESTNSPAFAVEDYQITPLANFHIAAKVLSKENYHLDREADLAPTDLALGWGPMSDEAVLAHFHISQSQRWYLWRTEQLVIPTADVILNSANMHLIPANDGVAYSLKKVRKGDIIEFSGKLVQVQHGDGWRWNSSLRRDDTGAGSCELVWVESLVILPP